MNRDLILQMKNQLDSLMQTVKEEQIEFWFDSTGFNPDDHFRIVTKMIQLGKGLRITNTFVYTQK